jgi:hypothetical protein
MSERESDDNKMAGGGAGGGGEGFALDARHNSMTSVGSNGSLGMQLREIIPKSAGGLVFSEKAGQTELLCKPKIMAIKRPTRDYTNVPEENGVDGN